MTRIVRVTKQVRWTCPNCPLEQMTSEARPHVRMHRCPGLANLTAPMVQAGTRVKVFAVEREDYIGREDVQYDANGRPVMSVVTDHADGRRDAIVFAPTAHMGLAVHGGGR